MPYPNHVLAAGLWANMILMVSQGNRIDKYTGIS